MRMEDRYAPSSTAMRRRRRPSQRSAYVDTMPAAGSNGNGGRPGFVDWFTGLTGIWQGSPRRCFVLLVIWLIVIATPICGAALLQGSTIALRVERTLGRSSLFNAVNAVYAVGSYELASKDVAAGRGAGDGGSAGAADGDADAAADGDADPDEYAVADGDAFADEYAAADGDGGRLRCPCGGGGADAGTGRTGGGGGAACVGRRLDPLGVRVDEAPAAPGQQYWRVAEVRWEDEQEAAGRHHIYVEVVDENGERIVGQPVTVFWSDGNFSAATEDKNPPDYAFNYQMYAAGNAYDVKVEGMPSEDVPRGRHGRYRPAEVRDSHGVLYHIPASDEVEAKAAVAAERC